MIQCKLTGNYQPASVLCSLLSQTSLREQLVNSAAKSKAGPKTFPVEFKAASSPPVFREKSKDECDKAVLEALSKANQNAVKNGNIFIPFSKSFRNPLAKNVSLKEGELTEAKQAGRDLAEQFIEKYPESFKIRFSDKMSMRKLTYIQEICRDRRTDRAVEIFEKVLAGDLECLEDEKKDLDALLDLFAYHNTDTATTQWATSYNAQMKCYEYRKEESNYPVPYSKSLFKTMDVERRNVQLITDEMLQDEQYKGLSEKARKEIINSFLRPDHEDNPGYMNSTIERYVETFKKDENPHWARFHSINTLPDDSSSTYISIMNDEPPALRLLSLMTSRGLVTSRNYDCVVQSAVRHYRPDLAWRLYREMRSEGWYPGVETVTDLVYSVTHEGDPSLFVSEGVEKITEILSDLADNPEGGITDELFLNLFYGVHLVPKEEEKGPQHNSEVKKWPSDIESEHVETQAGVHKYNYNILDDMIKCMEQGQFKLRYSIAFEMLKMHNLTVKDKPKQCFAIDLNNRLYELFYDSPEYFKRDLENPSCIKFVELLLSYARIHYKRYHIDNFYIKHRDNIIEIHKHYLQNGEDTAYRDLEAILDFDLIKVNGAPVPNRMFTSLESIRPVGPFQYYKDFYGDNLEHRSFRSVIQRLGQLVTYLESLNPYLVEVDYMLKHYKLLFYESMRAAEVCIKSDDRRHWTVALMLFLEQFFNQLNSKYLVSFFLTEDTRRALGMSDEEIIGAKSLKLSEENIMEVVKMATDAIQLLIDNEAMPSTIMAYILVHYTMLSGEHETAWRMTSLYNTYKIPLDTGPLLRYIELTPSWETEADHYISLIPEPLQSNVRGQIESLEKSHELDVLAICQLRHYLPVIPFQIRNNAGKIQSMN